MKWNTVTTIIVALAVAGVMGSTNGFSSPATSGGIGNDLPGTVGDNGIVPGTTYWYEVVTVTRSGAEIDNNSGTCYSVTVP